MISPHVKLICVIIDVQPSNNFLVCSSSFAEHAINSIYRMPWSSYRKDMSHFPKLSNTLKSHIKLLKEQVGIKQSQKERQESMLHKA